MHYSYLEDIKREVLVFSNNFKMELLILDHCDGRPTNTNTQTGQQGNFLAKPVYAENTPKLGIKTQKNELVGDDVDLNLNRPTQRKPSDDTTTIFGTASR